MVRGNTPYGEKRIDDVANRDQGSFTGHIDDSATGLTYMQARYYDPTIGRFLSIDPVGFKSSNAMLFNRYAYANNNPYKYIDPDGRQGERITFSHQNGPLNRQQAGRLNTNASHINNTISAFAGGVAAKVHPSLAGVGLAIDGLLTEGQFSFSVGDTVVTTTTIEIGKVTDVGFVVVGTLTVVTDENGNIIRVVVRGEPDADIPKLEEEEEVEVEVEEEVEEEVEDEEE